MTNLVRVGKCKLVKAQMIPYLCVSTAPSIMLWTRYFLDKYLGNHKDTSVLVCESPLPSPACRGKHMIVAFGLCQVIVGLFNNKWV